MFLGRLGNGFLLILLNGYREKGGRLRYIDKRQLRRLVDLTDIDLAKHKLLHYQQINVVILLMPTVIVGQS
jgi:hypothetical protein